MPGINSTNKKCIALLLLLTSYVFAQAQFSPADFGGLQLWLRADSGITMNGNFVAQWNDQSGNSNHATSDFDVIRPTLLAGALNGLPAVSFDGIEDFLQFPLIDDVRTVFWVLRENPNSTNAPPRPLLGWSGGLTYLRGDNKEFWNGSFSDPAVFGGATRLNFDNINGAQTIVPIEFCIASLVTTAPLNATHLTMELNIFGRTWWGEIAEVIIYNTPLSDAEVAQVETYLADKYSPTFVAMNDVDVEYGFCDTLVCAPDGFENYMWDETWSDQCLNMQQPGTYTLQMTDAFGRVLTDTIQVTYPGMLQLPDATICVGDAFVWDTGLDDTVYNFEWSDGTDESEVSITIENDYTLVVTDTNACTRSVSFHIAVDTFSEMVSLGDDAALCAGNAITPVGTDANTTFLWNTDEVSSSIIITTNGDYWVQATNANNCEARDTIYVEIVGVAPEISFDASGMCEAASTTFTANNLSSSNIASWQWNFGNGQTGSGETVMHTYMAAGNYDVELEAVTAEGCTQTYQQVVTINAKPLAQFTNTVACNNETILFTDNSVTTSGEVAAWEWLIDDVFYTGATVNAMIEESGFQSVMLSVTTTLGCIDEVMQSVNVLAAPVTAFDADATCEGQLTQFVQQVDISQSGAVVQFAWSFGDNTGSTLGNPSHFYTQAGIFEVLLAVVAANGCSDTVQQILQIHSLPVADFIVSNACLGQAFTLTSTSTAANAIINAWNWQVDASTFAEQNPVVIFDQEGLQPVQLSVTTEHGCTASVQQQIPVWSIPIAAFSFDPEIGEAPFECQFINESTGAQSAHWYFGDTYESDEYNPLHVFTLNGTAYTQLVAISSAGCRDTTGRILHIAAPVLDVMIQQVQCTTSDLGQVISAQLINTGNLDIFQLIMSYQVGNDAPVLEVWQGNFPVGSAMHFIFSSYMQQVGSQFPYICVTAETSPLQYTEQNLTDNQYCKPLANVGLEVFPPYPNPGDDRMFVRFITPIEGDLQLKVFDINGKVVMELEDEQVPRGYHQYFLDISALAEGSYKLQLQMNEAKGVVSFLKVRAK
ncbi:MAG: PKD domain-containing protein [Flavobacteriales bacterium]